MKWNYVNTSLLHLAYMENVFSLFLYESFLHYKYATLGDFKYMYPSSRSFPWLYSPFAFSTVLCLCVCGNLGKYLRGNPMSTSCIKAFENNINFESSQVMIIWEIFPFFFFFYFSSSSFIFFLFFILAHRKTLFLYIKFSQRRYILWGFT